MAMNVSDIYAVPANESFVPGLVANASIAAMLSGGKYHDIAPNYCEDIGVSAELIESVFEHAPYLKEMPDGFVCIFRHGDTTYTTNIYSHKGFALAAALHFIMVESDKS